MHTHYKGTGKVHSFRGLLKDGEQEEINIEGSVGAIAWRITKFQIMPENPHNANVVNHVMKLLRNFPSSITATVNFGDAELLGVATYTEDPGVRDMAGYGIVIFDNDLFNRNIFITNKELHNNLAGNYYIELEEVTVNAAGMAQLALASARRTGER